MASGAKIALIFAFMATMAMAAQAGTHKVSCKNNYCKPIKVNGIVIGVNATVDVFINETLTFEVENVLGKVAKGSCGCPLQVTAVELLGLLAELELGLDLEVKVTACTLPLLLGKILGILKLDLALCL